MLSEQLKQYNNKVKLTKKQKDRRIYLKKDTTAKTTDDATTKSSVFSAGASKPKDLRDFEIH